MTEKASTDVNLETQDDFEAALAVGDTDKAHRLSRAKAIQRISKQADVAGRVKTFLANEVLDFESMYKVGSKPDVTKEQILAMCQAAINDRKRDIEEIVPFLAVGQLKSGIVK
jgi:hypothetical protein